MGFDYRLNMAIADKWIEVGTLGCAACAAGCAAACCLPSGKGWGGCCSLAPWHCCQVLSKQGDWS